MVPTVLRTMLGKGWLWEGNCSSSLALEKLPAASAAAFLWPMPPSHPAPSVSVIQGLHFIQPGIAFANHCRCSDVDIQLVWVSWWQSRWSSCPATPRPLSLGPQKHLLLVLWWAKSTWSLQKALRSYHLLQKFLFVHSALGPGSRAHAQNQSICVTTFLFCLRDTLWDTTRWNYCSQSPPPKWKGRPNIGLWERQILSF